MAGNASSSTKLEIPSSPSPAYHPLRKAQQIPSSDPIPLETANQQPGLPSIPTYLSSPRHPPPRTRPRLFGLQECPTFHPSWEEFADPMKYIEYIGSPSGGNGKEYGIVKIIPPDGWHPEFVLDQERFRFRTRVQRLNSLSADARATLNYQEQLQKFHSQQGKARVSIPVIDRRPLDLYQLKLAVKQAGGFEALQKGRKWADLTRALGYPDKDAAHLAHQVKAAFVKIILPFEQFLSRARDQAKQQTSPSTSRVHHSASTPSPEDSWKSGEGSTAVRTEMRPNGTSLEEALQAENEGIQSGKRRSARRKTDTTLTRVSTNGEQSAAGGRRRRGRHETPTRDQDFENLVTVDGAEEQMCEICLRGDDGMAMLLCDECNRGYHMYCLDPPLAAVPKSQWYCPPCLVGTGNDYGFDDGETHSLDTFWKRSHLFRKQWFRDRPTAIWDGSGSVSSKDNQETHHAGVDNGVVRPIAGTDLRISEDDVEREFWRLIQSPDETVEVEYGADVHSTTHGSALPTLETHPLSPYARDGWNLNNLPILPASLLRYIKSDISGMTVPWIYVGMMFSTFCWHNEDHYTYSINYQHFGDTKTWYGVPGGDAEKFEEAMRMAAPDLFETSPDLLFQLVTMMSPEKLQKGGVRVYACDQRANEIVITYPKAYHSGFNQGFNLNEAVNFALPDWIGLDLECVHRYQQFLKAPVFSHDELIVTASQHSTSIDTANWLQHAYREMVTREVAARASLRKDVPGITEFVEDKDLAETDYQCAHCSCFCYLSQVTSPKAEGVSCLEHVFKVCGSDSPTHWTLRMRFSDEQLEHSLQKLVDRADQPLQWQQRFRKLLMSHRRPALRNLRGLLHEGERIAVKIEEVEQLREFVDKANDWVAQANRLMPKRYGGRPNGSHGGRSKSSAPRDDASVVDNAGGELDAQRTPEALHALLEEVEKLPFDAPEIGALREAVVMLEDSSRGCGDVLRRIEQGSDVTLSECEEVLAAWAGLNVEMPDYRKLQTYVAGRKWLAEMDEIHENHINLEEVQELMAEFNETDLPVDHHHYRDLQQRHKDGKQWQTDAQAALDESCWKTLAELQRLTTTPNRIPVVPELHVRLEKLLSHGRDWTRTVEFILSATPDGRGTADQLAEARRISRSIRNNKVQVPKHEDLQAAIELYDDWRDLLAQTVVVAIEGDAAYDLSAGELQEVIDGFCDRVGRCFSQDDDEPPSIHDSARQCICRVPNHTLTDADLRCGQCQTKYHRDCIASKDIDGSKFTRGRLSQQPSADWTCPLCQPAELPSLLETRRAVQHDLVRQLFGNGKFLVEKMRFKPPEYDQFQLAFEQSERMLQMVSNFLASAPDVTQSENATRYKHLLTRLLGSPVDLEVPPSNAINRCVQALFRLHNLDATGKAMRGVIPTSYGSATPSAVMDAQEDQWDATLGGDDDHPTLLDPRDDGADVQVDGTPATISSSKSDARKRKRGKRAKLVFVEEIGIWVPVNGERIYCLCHQKETGTMISCDRCMLWFHNSCVHVEETKVLTDAKWHCPMCCVKTERKYPHAEVKVKDIGVTDPNLWLDVRATLRSNTTPVSKLQNWSVPEERRIILHLDSFYPAIAAERAGPINSDVVKRLKQDDGTAMPITGARSASGSLATPSAVPHPTPTAHTSPPGVKALQPIIVSSDDDTPAVQRSAASINSGTTCTTQRPAAPPHSRPVDEAAIANERHRAGMANLYARGVTDAMIQKWFVGWNGRSLVYPRYDAYGRFIELDLGPRVSLEPDDPDGTRLISRALARQEREFEAARLAAVGHPWHSTPPQNGYYYEQDPVAYGHHATISSQMHHYEGPNSLWQFTHPGAGPSFESYPSHGGPVMAGTHHGQYRPQSHRNEQMHNGRGPVVARSAAPSAVSHQQSPRTDQVPLPYQQSRTFAPPRPSESPQSAHPRVHPSYGSWPDNGPHYAPHHHTGHGSPGVQASPQYGARPTAPLPQRSDRTLSPSTQRNSYPQPARPHYAHGSDVPSQAAAPSGQRGAGSPHGATRETPTLQNARSQKPLASNSQKPSLDENEQAFSGVSTAARPSTE